MPHANAPAGPGRPKTAERDAAKEAEQLDELAGDVDEQGRAAGGDPTRHARQAERDAHGRDNSVQSDRAPGKRNTNRGGA
jgi:hypothetical protein